MIPAIGVKRLLTEMRISLVIAFCLGCLLSSCSTLQTPVMIESGKQTQTVNIQASSFKFIPNNLEAYQGDRIVFKIENTSGSTHNFTIEDPSGKVLKNVDLPAEKSLDVEVSFPDQGVYKFYCAKPLHNTFGMSGQIRVKTR